MKNTNIHKNLLRESLKKEDFHLFKFRDNFIKQKVRGVSHEPFLKLSGDLSGIFYELRCIVLRINEDIRKLNKQDDLFKKLTRIDEHGELLNNELTEEERDVIAEKFIDLNIYINYYVLDIKSLYVWIMIFMDKLPKYLKLFINRKRQKISTYSFRRFVNSLQNQKGREIEQLTLILNAHRSWFEEIKDIRDDYTIHNPRITIPGITSSGSRDYISGLLGTTRQDKSSNLPISNEIIDVHLSLLKKILRDLNGFLNDNIQNMPF